MERNLKDHFKCRSSECEKAAIEKMINLSNKTNTKIHICHLSSAVGLDLLKNKTKNITIGTTPHHLLFNIDQKLKPEALYKVNPPIRSKYDNDILFQGIQKGYIDILESDHSPHTLEEKKMDFNDAPSGIPTRQRRAR